MYRIEQHHAITFSDVKASSFELRAKATEMYEKHKDKRQPYGHAESA
jgi:hypothetical protein